MIIMSEQVVTILSDVSEIPDGGMKKASSESTMITLSTHSSPRVSPEIGENADLGPVLEPTSSLAPIPKKCMTVRTLEESLDEKKTVQNRRLASIRRGRRLSLQIPSQSILGQDEISSPGVNRRSSDSMVRPNRNVGFSHLDIRSYPVILGDNPSVSAGAPLAIDWQHFHTCMMDIDEYECGRPTRRNKSEMRIPKFERFEILERAGEVDDKVEEAIKKVEVIKKKRDEAARTPMWQINGKHIVEKASSKVKTLLKKDRKLEEKVLLQKSIEYYKTRIKESEKYASEVDAATIDAANANSGEEKSDSKNV